MLHRHPGDLPTCPPFALLATLFLLGGNPGSLVAQGLLEPTRVPAAQLEAVPFSSAGLLEMEVNRSWYRGSAAVARDARLLFTCAHNVFDRGRWVTNVRFSRAWHDLKDPPLATSVPLRGYRYHSGYASAAQRFGDSSSAAFAADFAVGFGTESSNYGPPLPWLENGISQLTNSSTAKKILGYPSELDFSGRSGGYFQHVTGPFSRAFAVERGSYLGIDQVVTGPGNSGGPVLVQIAGTWHVAGILVSGSRNSAGVFALEDEATKVIQEALLAATGEEAPVPEDSQTFRVGNYLPVLLPDGSRRFTRRNLPLRQVPRFITRTRISLHVDTSYRGDLDVFLRSPRGRVRWLSTHDGEDDQSNLILTDADISEAFLGTNPNGLWQIFLRDVFPSDRALFQSVELEVSAR
jgi:hypothetical protein